MTCSRPYLLFAPALLTLGLTTFSLAPATAHAGEDPCAGISWNVADQRALFAEAESEAPGFAFVVRTMQLEFLKPARMDDLLEVVTRTLEVKGASITLAQEVRRGDIVLLEAKVKVAFVSGGQAQRIPKALRVAMKADLI